MSKQNNDFLCCEQCIFYRSISHSTYSSGFGVCKEIHNDGKLIDGSDHKCANGAKKHNM